MTSNETIVLPREETNTPEIGILDTEAKFTTQLDSIDPRLTNLLWRLENLYWITDKHGKIVKFKLNPVQRFLLRWLHPRNIILKARQLGMSTFIAILFLDRCLFRKSMKAAIVADKLENAKNIFAKIEFAWKKFPDVLKVQLDLSSESDSTSLLSWSNGSEFKVGTTLHSGTYQCLHISEYGPLCKSSPEKASDIKKSALPTVPDDGGLVFIESTAEGEGNDFHQMCLDAQEAKEKVKAARRLSKMVALPPSAGRPTDTTTVTLGTKLSKMEYKFFFFPWYKDAAYRVKENQPIPRNLESYFNELESLLKIKIDAEQRNWYVLKAKTLKDRMKEQFPSTPDEAFLSTGNKQFNADILNLKLKNEVKDPIWIDGDLLVFEHYKRGHMYGIGADVADGVGQDSSTMCVIDFTTNETVATYKSNQIDPVNFAFDLARVGMMYGGCVIAPENNRTGHTVCVKLAEIYSNVYQFEMKGYADVKQTIRLGWSTTVSTKPRMMGGLKAAFEDDENPLKIRDATIIREARMYAKDDNMLTTSAQILKTTRHFDLLIATAIAWEMRAFATVSMSDPRSQLRVDRNRANAQAGERRYR